MGRLHPNKNVDVLLKAMALLPESFSLAIGGDGPAQLRASLESLASKLGIQERVTWSGFISATEKDDFFDSIDVLVMCSDFESFGIVAAEAMMRGVPALVSPATGAAELIHGNGGGLVVPPTPEAVAQALSRLDRDADMMEKLSVQAIKASEQLSFSHVGPQMLEQYLDLVRAVSPRFPRESHENEPPLMR
jgi:glycosyltransferase involved in cell wall biosynthesis